MSRTQWKIHGERLVDENRHIPETVQMIERGEIVGAAKVVAVYRALSLPV
ncbi:hypothetical protein [Nocardia pneumoniae]|nr:hypothetical protein [Nocardia pneumoniae]